MPTALVTGATGFLGLNLVERLCAEGWEVRALVRPGADAARLRRFPVAAVAEADLADPAAVARAFRAACGRGSPPDAVFHAAAVTSPWSRRAASQARVNVDGTRNVAHAALAAGVGRLVLTSTWSTYGLGRAEISEASERLGLRSRVAYVRTKALAEEEVRRAGADGLRFAILNPAHMIGRYDARNWGRMFRMLDAGTLPGAPRLRGAFCHGAAVAAAHVAAARPGAPGGNYLLPGLDAGFDEVIGLAAEILGRPAPRRTVPTWLLRAAARAAVLRAAVTGREPDLTPAGVALMANHPRVASDRARRELGYEPPATLRPLVEDACAWLRGEGLVR